VLAGISSGAALSAAIKLAQHEEYTGKTIVVLLPDAGERCFSSEVFTNSGVESMEQKIYELERALCPGCHEVCGSKEIKRNFSGMKVQVKELIGYLRGAMYPEVFGVCNNVVDECCDTIRGNIYRAMELLSSMLKRIMPDCDRDKLTLDFMDELPAIKAMLQTDVQAAYEGDPAAKCCEEVMLAYPAFEAISIYRLAHKLYTMQVPILPRMMTEYAHRTTGIDIHPGAKIGKYFFIDHGTGVVIGETTTIGEHVKLYQGVTLGAKSFEAAPDGTLVKGIKRHPDIGNNVVVYSGATILGGDTHIGDNCTIGGNVWLTHSIESGKTVLVARERKQK